MIWKLWLKTSFSKRLATATPSPEECHGLCRRARNPCFPGPRGNHREMIVASDTLEQPQKRIQKTGRLQEFQTVRKQSNNRQNFAFMCAESSAWPHPSLTMNKHKRTETWFVHLGGLNVRTNVLSNVESTSLTMNRHEPIETEFPT